jgi:hypothetical protein
MLATPSKALFHSVAIGFMVGYGIFVLPAFLLMLLLSGISQHMSLVPMLVIAFVVLPIVLAGSSYMLSGFTMLGLQIVTKARGGKS